MCWCLRVFPVLVLACARVCVRSCAHATCRCGACPRVCEYAHMFTMYSCAPCDDVLVRVWARVFVRLCARVLVCSVCACALVFENIVCARVLMCLCCVCVGVGSRYVDNEALGGCAYFSGNSFPQLRSRNETGIHIYDYNSGSVMYEVLVVRLVGCLVGWFVGRSAGWSVCLFVDCSAD